MEKSEISLPGRYKCGLYFSKKYAEWVIMGIGPRGGFGFRHTGPRANTGGLAPGSDSVDVLRSPILAGVLRCMPYGRMCNYTSMYHTSSGARGWLARGRARAGSSITYVNYVSTYSNTCLKRLFESPVHPFKLSSQPAEGLSNPSPSLLRLGVEPSGICIGCVPELDFKRQYRTRYLPSVHFRMSFVWKSSGSGVQPLQSSLQCLLPS